MQRRRTDAYAIRPRQRLSTSRSGSGRLRTWWAVLGMLALLGVSASTAWSQQEGEGGEEEGLSPEQRRAACNMLGCPDTSDLHCADTEVTVTTTFSLFGFTWVIGTEIVELECHQGRIS